MMRSGASTIGASAGTAGVPAAESSIWRGGADRLARLAWRALVALIGFGLLAGAIIAAIHRPEVDWTVYNVPYMLQNLGYVLVLVLSLPSLAIGGWDLLRGRWLGGATRLLAFFGPFLVILGSEGLVSHLVVNCTVTGWACVDGDFTVRWHELHHTLVGLPLAALYWLALRKWHPAIARSRRVAAR